MNGSRRSRASRPWRRAAAVALGLHALLFALAVRSVRIIGPPPEPQAVDLQLVQLRPPPPRPERLRGARTARPSASPAAPSSPAPAAVAPAAPAAIPAPPSPSPSDDAGGRIRAMLRGSTGCDSADFLKLDRAEQRKCAQWRAAHVDPNLQIPAPIDPAKRSWFDADLQYRDLNKRMLMGPPGPLLEEMKKLTYGAPPGHVLAHVGPLSVGLAPGAFNDDDAPPP